MKKQLLYFTLSLALVAFVTCSCDNGNADPVIIDGPPVIESLTVTAGSVEGTDFAANAVVNDGIQGSTVSALATASWSVTGASGAVANGSESLSGDLATVNIAVAGGFAVGDYTLSLTVTDTNGNASTESVDFSVGSASPDFDISGDWRIEPVAGAFKVGPEPGSGEWWQNNDADVTTRACHFDDVYTFGQGGSGTFSVNMGDATWLERFQNVDPDQCGAPVAPFVSGDYQFTYTETQLTLIGQGAALAIAKVNNTGELGNEGVVVQDQIVYNIASQTQDGDVRRMTLQLEAGAGVWWEFLLISGEVEAEPSALVGTWSIAPEEGAIGVGPEAGNTAWWSIDAAGVEARACYFDDTWTFDDMGNMAIDMGAETWLETWQAAAEGCGAPTAPFENGTYSYTDNGATLTVSGVGAFVGLQKVNNGRELLSPNDAVGEITYNIADITETTMTLQIEIETGDGGVGWWQFKLVKAE